jgi:hypothetical protein
MAELFYKSRPTVKGDMVDPWPWDHGHATGNENRKKCPST